MQQEDEALEKFRFRNSMGHSLHADRETAPSTGFGYDWGGGNTQNSCFAQGEGLVPHFILGHLFVSTKLSEPPERTPR